MEIYYCNVVVSCTLAICRHGNNEMFCVHCNKAIAIIITTGAISISQALMVNQTLLELKIENNHIGHGSITAIAGSLSNSSITILDVWGCMFGFDGVRSLAVACQNIRDLELGYNPITVDGARLIMKSAVENGVCEYVGIDDEYKNDKEVKKMTTILDDRSRQNVR